MTTPAAGLIISGTLGLLGLGWGIYSFNANKRASSKNARQNYNSAIRTWANEALAALTDAIWLLSPKETAPTASIVQACSRLSALAEQGRLFFPNVKGSADPRGWRPRVLDFLIYAHDILKIANPESYTQAH